MLASKFRISAAHMFYFSSLCATSTALFGWFGLPIACFVVLIWVQIFSGVRREEETLAAESATAVAVGDLHPRSGLTKIELLVVLMIVALLVGLLIPATSDTDPMRQAEASMKMVAKALSVYEQEHGRPPPAVVFDAQGSPLHSWRALILPYLGEEKLATAYRMDEPWNSPHNASLAGYRPWHYRVYYPSADYPRTATSLHVLRDSADRLFVTEHELSVCNWLEPTEICDWSGFEHCPQNTQGFWDCGFFLSNYRGRLAVSVDQTLQIHPSSRGQLSLSDALRRDEPSAGVHELGQPHRQVHFDNALRLGSFLLVALYPLRWLTNRRRES